MIKKHILATLFAIPFLLFASNTVSADEAPQPNWDGTGDGTGALFFQTTGHSSNCNDGNWLTCTSGVNGDHFYEIEIPCDWPTDEDFHVDLFSPWFTTSDDSAGNSCDQATSNSVCSIDEDLSGTVTPEFHLYAPGVATVDIFSSPQMTTTGSAIETESYPEVSIDHEWVRFATISAPATCGTYILHEEVTWSSNTRNGWAIRTGYDDDTDPTNEPPSDFADPAAATSGTPIGLLGVEPEFGGPRDTNGPDNCLGFTFETAPAAVQPTFGFYTFDLDFESSITYTDPEGVIYVTDPQNASGWNGTGSVDTTNVSTVLGSVWDGVGDVPEIGDHFLNPTNGGVWHVRLCMKPEDHYYTSGPFGQPIFSSGPNAPVAPTAVSLRDSAVDSEFEINGRFFAWQTTLLLLVFVSSLGMITFFRRERN